MDTRDDYILTSSDEAFSLGESGRQILLTLAEQAYIRALRDALISLKEARDVESWNDFEQGTVKDYVGGLRAVAYEHFKSACQHDVSARSELTSAMWRFHEKVSGMRELDSLTYYESTQFEKRIRFFLQLHREAVDGALIESLRAMYAATDPTLSPEYAVALIPEQARNA